VFFLIIYPDLIFFIFYFTGSLISLDPVNNFVEIEAQPGENYVISTTNLSLRVAFSIVQANVYSGNVTLSYNRTLSRGYFTTGTNIGLVLYPDGGDGSVVYLRNSNSDPIHVLLGLQVYDSNGESFNPDPNKSHSKPLSSCSARFDKAK